MAASTSGKPSEVGSPASRLKAARNELGISQAKLASAIGIAQSTVGGLRGREVRDSDSRVACHGVQAGD